MEDGKINMEDKKPPIQENKIRLVRKDGQIEESAGKRKFWLLFKNGDILQYEKRMLCDSGCPYTLPMNFIYNQGKEKAYYDFTGFVQLKAYIERKSTCNALEGENLIYDSLDVLSKILDCFIGMENYLIPPGRISANTDVIFINSINGQIAFAFYPNEKEDYTLQNRITYLVDEIGECYHNAEVSQYFKKFTETIYMKNLGFNGMIGALGTIQREISYIYCNSKDFREIKENEIHSDECIKESNDKKILPVKLIAIQVALGISLIGIFLFGFLDAADFAGVAIIAGGVDLWIIKKFRNLNSPQKQ